ncbi:hypothetical protein RhiirA5_441494 [Rhizophagus irregularis]|uniref:Uncharacterized protein n=1 Tax=Rhizophagus irregularis TaxID=588596 RepID=A0A2N0NFN2_9GLOM|nr:hypothetical protein RhiirA5_441494 [Rhizophagus irregularis]
MTYNVNSPKIFSMFQLNSSPYEVLADICAPGFAVIDWFLTCLSSVIRAFCLSCFWKVLGVTV